MARPYLRYSMTRQSLESLYEVVDHESGETLTAPEPYAEARVSLGLLTRRNAPPEQLEAKEVRPGCWAV